MGTWSTGVFDDDLAVDLRTEYRSLLEQGLSGPAATDALLARGRPDEDEEPVFWIALAATQSRLGRLEERVRDRALALVERDLERWAAEPPMVVRKRRKVLDELRDELLGPPRPEVRIRPYRPMTTEFAGGEIIAWERDDGRFALLRVAMIEVGRTGDRVPVVEVLDWSGTTIPALDGIRRLRILPAQAVSTTHGRAERTGPALLHLMRMTPADRRRITVLGTVERSAPKSGVLSNSYLRWSMLDDELRGLFGEPPHAPSE